MLTALLALALAAGAPPAPQRTVRCDVGAGSGTRYQGKCQFEADRDGSFALTRTGDAAIVDDIVLVSVSVIEPGVAEVRGLTRDGINSRWGTAHRSKRERACWIGADFRICAY